MAEHYNYLSFLSPVPDVPKFVVGCAVGVAILGAGAAASRRFRGPSSADAVAAAVVPPERPDLPGAADFVVESFVKFHDAIVGKENRRYASFTLSVFLFTLTSNLLGLVPGMPAVTTTVWIDVGMALAVFLYFNYLGVREHGLVGYLKHFAGPLWWLAWFIFPLEIFSTTLRILTLNLRLYWNITADHMVLGIITDLLKVGAIPIYVLGTFVSFMQALVFTILSMVYIRLATEHADDHGHSESGAPEGNPATAH